LRKERVQVADMSMQEFRAEPSAQDRGGTIAFLAQHPPYDRMEPAHLDYLASRLRQVTFEDGEAITDPMAGPAEWFYILRSGLVIGEKSAEDEAISGDAFELIPGECFPIGALVARRAIRNIQRASGEVVCLTMRRSDFDQLRTLSQVFSDYCTHRLSGLIEKVNRKVRAEAARDLGDDSSLSVTLREKRLRRPMTTGPDVPIVDVLERMSEAKIGSMLIVDDDGRPIGIFTLRDLLNRVALGGVPYTDPIRSVMTENPITIPHSAFAFEVAMKMAHAGIHHLVVVEDGRLKGVISERDLFSMQRVGLVNLSKSITKAPSVEEVARLAADIHALVAQMIAQGMKVSQITQIITLLNDQIAVRLIEMILDEEGGAPFPFTWMAFGSEGRQEQTLKTDQDNGILFHPPEGMDADACREVLLPIATKINLALDACGFPLCTGGIMAQNPECCLTLDEWRRQFSRWVYHTDPENLLKATIFFDFRPIWGPEEPVRALRQAMFDLIRPNGLFQRQMAANALRNSPPLGMFRDFRLSGKGQDANTLDLKVNGVTLFIDAARILSLAHGIASTNTVERIEGVARAGGMDREDAVAWVDAYDYIRLLRMRMNDEQSEAGEALSNRIHPSRLSELDRRILKEALREAKRLQTKLALDYHL
jgi:CBS domain-containing protein